MSSNTGFFGKGNRGWRALRRHVPRLCGLMALVLVGAFRAEAAPDIAVIYPEVREPYKKVFEEIVRGIENGVGQSVNQYILDGGNSPDSVLADMQEDGIDIAISLGRAGLAAGKQFAGTLPVVVGAVVVAPSPETQGMSGISLIPDPEVLFARLKMMVPDASQVTVIYDPRQKAWEIEYAHRAARKHGLTLNAYPSQDLRLSAELYRNVLAEIKNGSICLWLPQDNAAMDERALLPLVLQEAWERNFVVFSSNLDHVRKGALFSLYPDNYGMGRSLAKLALERLQSGKLGADAITPLRDVLLAVNLRTAQHLGLHFASGDRQAFDLVFPTP